MVSEMLFCIVCFLQIEEDQFVWFERFNGCLIVVLFDLEFVVLLGDLYLFIDCYVLEQYDEFGFLVCYVDVLVYFGIVQLYFFMGFVNGVVSC